MAERWKGWGDSQRETRARGARGHFPSHYIRYYSLYPFGKKRPEKNEGDKKVAFLFFTAEDKEEERREEKRGWVVPFSLILIKVRSCLSLSPFEVNSIHEDGGRRYDPTSFSVSMS